MRAGHRPVTDPGRLRRALGSGRFVVTAEIDPPRGADPGAIAKKAQLLRGWVDAANVTDDQSAHVWLSSFAGSLLALSAGVEPVMQLTCRDRSRIALQPDLISAATLSIPNILLLTGDHPRFGDHPDAKAVFDLDGVQLVWTARTMRDQGRLLSDRRYEQALPGGESDARNRDTVREMINGLLGLWDSLSFDYYDPVAAEPLPASAPPPLGLANGLLFHRGDPPQPARPAGRTL